MNVARRMYPNQRQNALDSSPQEFRWFAKFAESGFQMAAAGLFADVLLQIEIGGTTEYRAEMVRVAASMWHATVFHTRESLISHNAAEGVAPLLWMTISNLCRFGHPHPADVRPDDLKQPQYIARSERWQSSFGLILDIKPDRLKLADLMTGV